MLFNVFFFFFLKSQRSDGVSEELLRGSLLQKAEIKQLEESKETLEAEIEEIQSQLRKDGFDSLAEMRCTFSSEMVFD